MPVRFDAELTDTFSRVEERQGIGILSELLESSNDGNLRVDFTSQEMEILHKLLGPEYREWMFPFRRISKSQLSRIVDRVRNIVLDWSLELEQHGILGENMTFSNDEKKKAADTQITINGPFQGNIGDIDNSVVSQNFSMNVTSGDFDSLANYLRELNVPDAEIGDLKTAVDADPNPPETKNFGPKVANWFGSIVGKAAGGTYELAIGAGGGLLAEAISKYYGLS